MEINQVHILLIAFILDALMGDPRWLPHLIVLFGNAIAKGEKLLNKGKNRFIKGMLLTLFLVTLAYTSPLIILSEAFKINPLITPLISIILLFYCLANRTLIDEGKAVFKVLKEHGLEAGRKRLSWIVGRDTSKLNEQQIRTATLETLSENLSDGVIAPLFYFFILGIPGAVAYKMINTLDSMVGYKSDRYKDFGKFAAKLDDVANYIPARLTAFLILLVTAQFRGISFVFIEGKKHSSPNAGFPEAALAYVLRCQFGGPNMYHGKLVVKPYIGDNQRTLIDNDINLTSQINWYCSVFLCLSYSTLVYIFNLGLY